MCASKPLGLAPSCCFVLLPVEGENRTGLSWSLCSSLCWEGDQSISLPELEHTMQVMAGGLGFLFWEQKAAWTRPLSDLRVQVYVPKRGVSKPVRYSTKGLRICFRRWFNMSAVV